MEPLLIWGIALLVVAFALIAVEAFVPSGGAIGVLAGLAAIGSVICLWMVSWTFGLTGLLIVLILGPMAFFGALNMLPATPLGRSLLGEPSEEEVIAREMAERAEQDARAALVGATGTALTDLRPIGRIEINGQRYEALAETGAIDRGESIRVTGADMHELRVRRAE